MEVVIAPEASVAFPVCAGMSRFNLQLHNTRVRVPRMRGGEPCMRCDRLTFVIAFPRMRGDKKRYRAARSSFGVFAERNWRVPNRLSSR